MHGMTLFLASSIFLSFVPLLTVNASVSPPTQPQHRQSPSKLCYSLSRSETDRIINISNTQPTSSKKNTEKENDPSVPPHAESKHNSSEPQRDPHAPSS
ncbi:hypothetical protein B0T22DRAFT_450096 [Podospora appendiculata]|uniref:Secreted protein n=1 Tax=Podospora appendiculata TaxID=314037 RepID=A0AAE0XIE5_9PEZI|nr:hypothetical protein B0T22DRAFT_450096 [Podospora appendiculata]